MISNGIISNFADIFILEVEDLTRDDIFTEREALLVLATVHMVKPVKDDAKLLDLINDAKAKKKKFQAWQFFGALGIKNAGKTIGKLLVDHYGSFDKIIQATEDELLSINDVGPATASCIVEYFKNNKKHVSNLLEHVELEYPKTGKLSGQKFVLTGGFTEGKSYWEKAIEECGGKCGSSVSSSTNYVVVGTDAGIKAQKATELGIQKLTVQQLKDLLNK